MSRQNVGFHYAIIKDLAPDVLKRVENTFATQNLISVANDEKDVVAENANALAINWSFRWFRSITPLPHRFASVDGFVTKANKTARQRQSKKVVGQTPQS